ncbi:MAG: efflux RND transporter periplasmic adaptor subunit [Waddliaceae bacterium]
MRALYPILLSFLMLTGCRQPPEEEEAVRPVKAMQVSDPTLILSRPFPGVARAENRVNLAFRVEGPLIELPIYVGEEVKKGETLARIDPRDYEISLRNAKAELEKTKAVLTFAKSDFARAERIQKEDPGAISESKVDQKREERNRLRAVVAGNRAKVEGAEDQLSYTYMRAPFDGVIVAKYFDNFEYVQAKQSVARMLDTSRIEMVVDIPGNLIPHAQLIKNIEVTFGPFPDLKLQAEVREIGEEASAITRTFPVTLVMKQPKKVQILAGMSGEARFVGQIAPDSPYVSILIPTSAVFTDGDNGQSYVWVIDVATLLVHKRKVTLEQLTSRGIQVSEGICPGEWIAVAGVHSLRESQKVEILGCK